MHHISLIWIGPAVSANKVPSEFSTYCFQLAPDKNICSLIPQFECIRQVILAFDHIQATFIEKFSSMWNRLLGNGIKDLG